MNKKIYYLAHPYGSCGDKAENVEENKKLSFHLWSDKGIVTINPLNIIPFVTDIEEKAIEKCRLLFLVCDSLILAGEWRKSAGCLQELKWAIEQNKEIFEYRNGELIKYTNEVIV